MGILELLLKITADSSDARADFDQLRTSQSSLVTTLTGALAAGLNAASASFRTTTQATAEGSRTTETYTVRTQSAAAAQRELQRTQAEAARQGITLAATQARASAQQAQAQVSLGAAQARATNSAVVGQNQVQQAQMRTAATAQVASAQIVAAQQRAAAATTRANTQQQVSALALGVAQARAAQQLGTLAQQQERATNRAFISHLRQGTQAANQFGQGLRTLGRTLSVSVTAPLVAAGYGVVTTATQMDTLKRGLLAVEGSADAVNKRLEILKEVAKLPGIGFKEAIQGQIRLEAVGFAADGATRTLRAFAKAVALTGGGKEELDRITVQLGQIAAKGKLMAQDLRPILEAAPAVGNAVRAAFGTIDTEAIQKLHLTSEQLFAKLLPELEKLPEVTGGARNAFENLDDSLFRLGATVGEAIAPALIGLLNLLENVATQVAAYFSGLPVWLQQAILGFFALVAAIGPVILVIGGVITTVATFVGGIISAAAAVGGFIVLAKVIVIALAAVAVLFIQLLPVIIAVGAAVAAMYVLWQRNIGGIRELVFSAFTAIRNFLVQVWNEIRAVYLRVLPEIQANISAFVSNVQAFWNAHGAGIVNVIQQAWEIIKNVVITGVRVIGEVITFFLRVFRGDWAGAWDSVLNVLSVVLIGWAKFAAQWDVIVATILVKILVQLSLWQTQLEVAALKAAVKLIDGFVYYTQGEGLIRAVAAVLAIAAAISSPSVLAAYALAGAQAAKARSDAYDKGAAAAGQPEAPKGDLTGGTGDFAPSTNLFKPGLGSGGAAAGGGKKKRQKEDHTARDNAEAADQIAQTELQTAERVYSEEVAAAERAYTRRFIALEAYVARAKTAEEARLAATLNALNTERDQVDAREKNEEKRKARRAALDEREKAARADFNKNIQTLDDKSADVQIDSLKSHRESLLRVAAAYDQQRIDAYKAAADRQSISAETAEARTLEIQRAALDRRRQVLDGDLALAGSDAAARQEINDQLAELATERAGFEIEATRRITAARDADLERARQAARDLKQLQEDTMAQAIALGQLDIERLEREKANSDEIARARRDNALAAAELERRTALRRLEEEKDEALKRVKGLQDELEKKKEINELYRERELLSIEEFERRKKEIEDKYKHEKEDDDSILGPLDEEVGKIGDFGDAAETLGNRIAATFSGIKSAVGDAISSWVIYGKTQGAIIRRVLAEQLAALAKEAAMRGLEQTARALAALAVGNFGAAAKHGLAAAAWFALAGGSAALGRKVAGDLFNQGGAGAGGGNAGTGNGSTDAAKPEKAIIEQGRNQLTQTIILRVESNDSHIISVAAKDITTMNGPLRAAVVQVVEG